MKKIKYLLMILVICLLTGCVKYNVNMGIKKDKSMDFDITYAVNKTLLGDQDLLEDENKREIESEGFTIKDYVDGDMIGYVLTKKIKNIDDYSTTMDTDYSLSGILEENADSPLFKVTKGLIKNTYKAKFSFDSNDSGLTYNNDTTITDDTTSDEETTDTDIDTDTDLDLNGDLSSLTEGMDLSFNVTLPYAAKSHNATSTSDGLKKLTWKLDSSGMDDIEFEFELYNMTNIYVGIGVLALFIILVIVIILGVKKGKDKPDKKDNKDKQTEVKPVEPSNPTENTKEEIKEEKAQVKINEPISPVMPSQGEAKEEVKPVNPMESIDIVPVVETKEPTTPEILPEVSTPISNVIPVEPKIVVPSVVAPVESLNTETKVESQLPEPTKAKVDSPKEDNKPKIEQLEDGL